MKRLLATTALVAMLPVTAAMAGTVQVPVPATQESGSLTFLLGIGVEFGDSTPDVGITGKVLSSNLANNLVVGGGVTYFPMADEKLGLDLSAGLNLTNFAVLGGYDFLRQKPQLSIGYVPTIDGGLTCPPGYDLSGGTCYPIALSDRRKKRGIRHIATLSDGIRLYSFRYLWSETVHVGVMAQDLLEDSRWSHAVLTGSDGYYLVDYDQLDLMMVTIEEWNERGVDAVVLGSRPARLLAAQAA
ncbi:MAG TPA: tail fiber domain-containing protein [Devosia sp.]|nr:tail fiber domain-containing protein [Devosia sp.]